MISVIKGDLFDSVPVYDSKSPIVIAHGCNAQGKMRSGFAKAVRSLNEDVYNEYIKSKHKLGTVSYVELFPNVYVANCVTQQYYGYDGSKYTSYDAVDSCFDNVSKFIKLLDNKETQLFFPLLGAVLGGGKVEIINNIIDVNVSDSIALKVQFLKD